MVTSLWWCGAPGGVCPRSRRPPVALPKPLPTCAQLRSAPAFRYTSPATEASNPVWSPDGSLLAFTSKREGFDDDVWFLRTTAPGGEAFQARGVHATPVFSGDGKWLLYSWRGS